VLIYTTLNHVKYCLPNGDNGIIRTLDQPVYVTRVAGGVIYALDREGKTRQIQVRAAAAAAAAGGWWLVAMAVVPALGRLQAGPAAQPACPASC
jgi:hypothetical protein